MEYIFKIFIGNFIAHTNIGCYLLKEKIFVWKFRIMKANIHLSSLALFLIVLFSCLFVCFIDEFADLDGGKWLWSFNWGSQSPGPNQLGQNSKRPRNSEKNCVELQLLQTVVLQQDARMGIDVWIRIRYLVELLEHLWYDLPQAGHQLYAWIILAVLHGKLVLQDEPRIGVPKDSVSVAGNDLEYKYNRI